MSILAFVLSALFAYLIGSIDFGIVVSKLVYKQDIRQLGSGNAGTTNILRNFGKKAAALTLVGDFLKGTVAVLFAKYLASHSFVEADATTLGYCAAAFALLGHLYPLYFGFKGGKGVAVAAGTIMAVRPSFVAVLFVVLALVLIISKMVSLASIVTATAYPVVTYFYYHNLSDPAQSAVVNTAFAGAMAVIVIFMHKENIKRIISGTEYKFGAVKNK